MRTSPVVVERFEKHAPYEVMQQVIRTLRLRFGTDQRFRRLQAVLASAGAAVVLLSCTPDPPGVENALASAFRQLTRATEWTPVAVFQADFDAYHPQGFAKVGEHLFLSSVEVIEPTQRVEAPRDGLDRTAGRGRGHLFKMDLEGRLLTGIELGEGDAYHPGGIDFDGRHLWVPVAEYRPDSRSIIYRVDPTTMEAEEAFRFDDHVGALVFNTDDETLHGVSWGSRRFYTWRLGDDRVVASDEVLRAVRATANPAHYIDYQDCQYLGDGEALCAGLTQYRQREDAPAFSLGGIEMVDLRTVGPLYQIPVMLWTETGLSLTQNPVFLEVTGTGIRAYFMPEDHESRLFVYEAVGGAP